MSDTIVVVRKPNPDLFDGPDAIKIQFLKPIFEDDFMERGMLAWFIRYEWDNKSDCYALYFDFEDFENYNKKYFTESYFENIDTKKLVEKGHPKKSLWTALEAGYYKPKMKTYLSLPNDERDDKKFKQYLLEYITPIYLKEI